MTQPDQTQDLMRPPLPEPLQAWLRQLAVKKVGERKGPLWSCSFPLPGLKNDVSVELLPSLVLRIRNRATQEVYMQTEPVQFGPMAQDDKTLAERFEQWCAERATAPVKPPVALPDVVLPSAEGGGT
jgi:hypothetical protein